MSIQAVNELVDNDVEYRLFKKRSDVGLVHNWIANVDRQKQRKSYVHEHSSHLDHAGGTADIDGSAHLLLFVTCGRSDRLIKLWNSDNDLVRELDPGVESCSCCAFLNERCDLLVAAGRCISLFTAASYLPVTYLKRLVCKHSDYNVASTGMKSGLHQSASKL